MEVLSHGIRAKNSNEISVHLWMQYRTFKVVSIYGGNIVQYKG